jgi:hypothetical protein
VDEGFLAKATAVVSTVERARAFTYLLDEQNTVTAGRLPSVSTILVDAVVVRNQKRDQFEDPSFALPVGTTRTGIDLSLCRSRC